MDIVKADADLLSASFNASIARWLTEWNFPGAAVPGVWRVIEEPEDMESRARRDKSIYEIGYKPTLRYIEETYGGEWEVTGEPLANPPKVGAGGAAAFAAAAAPGASWLDRATDQLDEAAQPAVDAMIGQVRAMLDGADSLEEFRARLLAAYPDLDSGGMVAAMQAAFAAAELQGQYEVTRETPAVR